MDPSELKKLRNKQRKAQKKAELEKQSEQKAAAKKEMHNKAQKKNNEEELDSPAKDDLVAEKLERPENPLDEAIKFLTPLQLLSSKCLNTHLLAFEIYYRKGKLFIDDVSPFFSGLFMLKFVWVVFYRILQSYNIVNM